MRYTIIIIFLLALNFSYGQMSVISAVSSNKKAKKNYVSIPAAQVFSDPVTVNHQTTSTDLSSGELSGKTQIKIGRTLIDYPAIIPLNLSGSYSIQSLTPTDPSTWSVIGGSGSGGNIGAAAIRPSGSSEPSIHVYNIRTTLNQSAFSWSTSASQMDIELQNMIGEDHTFAGIQVNVHNTGQSYYNFTARFVRILRSAGEGFYLGNTSSEESPFTGTTIMENNYVEHSGREGFQFNGHANLQATNLTARYTGEDTGQPDNQRCLVQVQNCKGYLKNSIFTDGYNCATVAVNNFLFENCFFGFTSTSGTFFMGNMLTNGYTTYAEAGATVTFRNCTFYNPNFVASTLFDIRERNCNIVFEGTNTFPASATSVWADNRGASPPYTITNNGTFVFTNNPPIPVFIDPPESAYVGFEKVVADDYYYYRGMGYRTR